MCKTCEHAIRPREVLRHLQSANHRLPIRIARQITHVVQTSDRAHECDEWQPPTAVNDPIPNLPVFSDGILCEKDPFCQFIARSVGTLRTIGVNAMPGSHLLTWRPSAPQQGLSEAEQQIQQFTRIVRCQRAFPRARISLYSRTYARGGGHCRGRFNARDRGWRPAY